MRELVRVNRMKFFVTVPLLSSPLLSLPKRLINKVAIVTRMKVKPLLSNMDFHSSRPTWLQPLLSAQSASSRHQG